MNISTYKQTPEGTIYVLKLFQEKNLSYILFKCEHIFAGKNKNLDILFETEQDYHQAAQLLERYQFAVRLSEKIEKYKTMYCGFYRGIMYSIHLHREVAWHGLRALDKKPLFLRKKIVTPLIITPSLEDSILIHTAHIIFENFNITEKERFYLDQIDNPQLDKKYIAKQIARNHWRKGFKYIIKQRNKPVLSKAKIARSWITKLFQEPATMFYLCTKISRRVLRAINPQRKGSLIAFIGVNGSGKSTLTKTMLESYQPVTTHLGLKQSYYYFGWKPTFPLTKFISGHLQRKDTKIFQELNLKSKIKRFDLKQELLFLYLWFEFYYRYRKEILPLLRKRQLVVCDRYFYDLYGQYPYAKNSILIKPLLWLFPKPDFIYVLDVETAQLQKRHKTDKEQTAIRSLKRNVFPVEYLQQQRRNFHFLARFLGSKIINTNQSISLCTEEVMDETWKRLI